MAIQRLLPVLVALVAFALVMAAGASAGPVSECGDGANLGPRGQIVNVTTRAVGCAKARRFARDFHLQGCHDTQSCQCAEDRFCTYRRFSCRNVDQRTSSDHRCTRGTQVIRWQRTFSG